ncbi:VOC family protein, partial [Streptomyces asiaticus]
LGLAQGACGPAHPRRRPRGHLPPRHRGGHPRVEIVAPGGSRMAFLRDHGFAPPSWPRPDDSQQAHLDLLVEDIDAAERQVVDLGARPLDTKNNGGLRDTRIYSDPAGHPFSLRRT